MAVEGKICLFSLLFPSSYLDPAVSAACRAQPQPALAKLFLIGSNSCPSLIWRELGLLKISRRRKKKGPAIFQLQVCVVQNKHSWNSVDRHTYQPVDMLQAISLRPAETPILEDDPPDCFSGEIFPPSPAILQPFSACTKSYVAYLQPWWCKWPGGTVTMGTEIWLTGSGFVCLTKHFHQV